MMGDLDLDKQLEKMRRDWDERARKNARHYVVTGQEEWSDDEFFRSGEQTVKEEILTDMINVCQGKEPNQMRVLEIGCGAGRITRALAGLFGEVHAARALLKPFQQEQWAIGIRKGRDDLKRQVNAFLADFKSKGGFDRLVGRYVRPVYHQLPGYVDPSTRGG